MIDVKILPLGNVPDGILDAVAKELKAIKVKGKISLPMALPKDSYNPLRHQFLASNVLDFLVGKFEERILGVTNKDLYAGNLNFVFGQAQLGGRVAVVSIHRLDPKFYRKPRDEELLMERAVKEAKHEVCHMLFNMKHCENPECVMSFSNTIFDVDRKTKNLCDECKIKIGARYG